MFYKGSLINDTATAHRSRSGQLVLKLPHLDNLPRLWLLQVEHPRRVGVRGFRKGRQPYLYSHGRPTWSCPGLNSK